MVKFEASEAIERLVIARLMVCAVEYAVAAVASQIVRFVQVTEWVNA